MHLIEKLNSLIYRLNGSAEKENKPKKYNMEKTLNLPLANYFDSIAILSIADKVNVQDGYENYIHISAKITVKKGDKESSLLYKDFASNIDILYSSLNIVIKKSIENKPEFEAKYNEFLEEFKEWYLLNKNESILNISALSFNRMQSLKSAPSVLEIIGCSENDVLAKQELPLSYKKQ
ncbi:hypothetical protein [Pseudoalteromonas sp. NGC95]|uniref:hypothetical protein n=1 Tax=Pseudoalteromonas sp. NGC95 TaxID=2792051 RepID=UPI0018CD5B93|nr:hypothetical protein [Pseudoalteromonas sp. NGC95]MBH0018740.1 hypothetical protein [Pseudoalteromonas sp. NGC95]